jgi:hypothetical protein
MVSRDGKQKMHAHQRSLSSVISNIIFSVLNFPLDPSLLIRNYHYVALVKIKAVNPSCQGIMVAFHSILKPRPRGRDSLQSHHEISGKSDKNR